MFCGSIRSLKRLWNPPGPAKFRLTSSNSYTLRLLPYRTLRWKGVYWQDPLQSDIYHGTRNWFQPTSEKFLTEQQFWYTPGRPTVDRSQRETRPGYPRENHTFCWRKSRSRPAVANGQRLLQRQVRRHEKIIDGGKKALKGSVLCEQFTAAL